MSAAARRFVLAAGGTGGHMIPAHALGAELRSRGHRVSLLTDERGLRFPGLFAGVDKHVIPAATIEGMNPIRWLRALRTIARGKAAAASVVEGDRPGAVIGFGGYPALPALLAAGAARVPTVIHEQNAVLGRVNRLLASRVDAIATAYAQVGRLDARLHPKVTLVGNPVRAEVLALRGRPFAPPAPGQPFNLLVIGGSQGATVLSKVVPEAVALLTDAARARLRVVQQCRPEDLDAVRARYVDLAVQAECATYMADMPEQIGRAHLVIARSGASTMAELGVIGRPAILVPFAAATDDHQTANAREFVAAGGGPVIAQSEFTPRAAADAIATFIDDANALRQAAEGARSVGRPEAAAHLADLVERLAGLGASPAAVRPAA